MSERDETKLRTFDVLDHMTQMIDSAKTIPLYKRIMLEKEEFTSLMRRLSESIPADLQKAKAIIDQEEQILSESRNIADETTRKATAEANAAMAEASTLPITVSIVTIKEFLKNVAKVVPPNPAHPFT